MDKQELLERYEALGEESDFLAAKPLYEQALAGDPDARVLNDYGYLLYAHARRQLRRAVELFERAIELEPGFDKPHYQLIVARAALEEPELAVARYEQRLAASPGEPRGHRFLAASYLRAHAYDRALEIVEAGLSFAPDDAVLVELRGEAKAGVGDTEGALADWRRSLALDEESIGGLYMSAFLLEREGRPAEAVDTWRAIIDWNESRGYTLQTVWPKQELERLRSTLAGGEAWR
jgi:tetratricopeptide (TPR) repeat protein